MTKTPKEEQLAAADRAVREIFERHLDRGIADLDERLRKHVHAMAIAEGDTVLRFVDGLRARGVLAFEGLGLKIALAELPPGDPIPPAPGQPHANGTGLVDAGGGMMVDPDALGHEA